MPDEGPSVDHVDDLIVARYHSVADGSGPSDETISSHDIVRIVIERVDYPEGPIVHWLLQHRDGWTLHFNDAFRDADRVIAWLQSRFQFALPSAQTLAVAGEDGMVIGRARPI